MHDFGTSREPQKCDEEIFLCFIRAETESHADGPSEAADGKHIITTPLGRNRGLCPSGLHTRAQDQFGSNVCELTPSNCSRHSWYGCRNRGHKSGKWERKGGIANLFPGGKSATSSSCFTSFPAAPTQCGGASVWVIGQRAGGTQKGGL